jgi:hypothetical protein
MIRGSSSFSGTFELYRDRVNPGSLWGAANTAKKIRRLPGVTEAGMSDGLT